MTSFFNKRVRLNRLDLTGKIDDNTPVCVILDIARCNGIIFDETKCHNEYVNNLISNIERNTLSEIFLNSNFFRQQSKDLPNLIRYINPKPIYWTSSRDIINAYSHIQQYTVDEPPLPKENFTVGFKTPFNLMSYDSCMLYKICRCHQIKLNRKTSLEEMSAAVRMLSFPVTTLSQLLASLNKSDIISTLIYSTTDFKEEKKNITTNYEPNKLTEINRLFSRSNELIKRVFPESMEEAVFLAAKNYGIDITEAIYPIDEYKNLKTLSKRVDDVSLIQQEYIPNDLHFRNHYKRSSWLYNVKNFWKPLFSFLYTQNRLIEFALNEGFTQIEIGASTPEKLLHISRITNNFYPGTIHFSVNDNSPIDQDTISNLKSEQLVCYGALDDRKMVTFKLSELDSHFLNYKAFLNPFDLKEAFSPRSIRKLKNLAKNIPLNRTITVLQQNVSKQFESLFNIYKNSSKAIQENIVIALRNLLEVSFYMRGWKVSTNDFPLTRESTGFPSERAGEVYVNTTEAICRYEKFLSQLPENIVSEIKSLPLLGISKRKEDNSLEFITQTNKDQGLTIFDRLEIVKAGKSDYSCIRLSSNYLAASAYCYLHLITGIEPFDMSQFSYGIS